MDYIGKIAAMVLMKQLNTYITYKRDTFSMFTWLKFQCKKSVGVLPMVAGSSLADEGLIAVIEH